MKMRIAIATVQVPFVSGGAEVMVNSLCSELKKRGHSAEIVSIPFIDKTSENLMNSMISARMVDLNRTVKKIDLVIGMKFPAYYVQHEHKIMWLMHQHRAAYDLLQTEYSSLDRSEQGRELIRLIHDCDCQYIPESEKIFTIAKNSSKRLMKYNGIDSEPLYHPPMGAEDLYCSGYGDFVFYPSRITRLKRQMLLIRAAKYLRTNAKIVIAGSGAEEDVSALKRQIALDHTEDRVILKGFVSMEEMRRLYAECLAVYFGTYDEDYGYITLEGMFSQKAVITHTDSGGPLEFVEDGYNGYVTDPEPEQIAAKIDELYRSKKRAEQLGKSGLQTMKDKNISWDYAISRLLEE